MDVGPLCFDAPTDDWSTKCRHCGPLQLAVKPVDSQSDTPQSDHFHLVVECDYARHLVPNVIALSQTMFEELQKRVDRQTHKNSKSQIPLR